MLPKPATVVAPVAHEAVDFACVVEPWATKHEPMTYRMYEAIGEKQDCSGLSLRRSEQHPDLGLYLAQHVGKTTKQ